MDGTAKITGTRSLLGHDNVTTDNSGSQSSSTPPSDSTTLRFQPNTNEQEEATASRGFSRSRSTPLHDKRIGNDASAENTTGTNIIVPGFESEFKLQNAKSNLPPWLRTQQNPIPTSDSPVAMNVLDQMTKNIATRPSDTNMFSVPAHITQKTQNEQFGNSLSPQDGDNANNSAKNSAFSQAVGPTNSVSTHTGQGQGTVSSSSGHRSLPAIMQGQILPTVNSSSLLPTSQPNSTFAQSGSGSMMSFAAQRVLFPSSNNLTTSSSLQSTEAFDRCSAPGI